MYFCVYLSHGLCVFGLYANFNDYCRVRQISRFQCLCVGFLIYASAPCVVNLQKLQDDEIEPTALDVLAPDLGYYAKSQPAFCEVYSQFSVLYELFRVTDYFQDDIVACEIRWRR